MRYLIGAALLTAVLLPRGAAAQRTWPTPGAGEIFGLEVGKAVYRPIVSSSGPGFMTAGTVTVTESALIPLGSRLALSFELPFSALGERVGGASISANKIGNPWLGMEATMKGGVVVELGIRPGIVGGDQTFGGSQALGNGVTADYDHYEAWLPGYHTARASVAWSRNVWHGFFLGATAGASLGIPTGATDDEDRDVYVLYGVRAGWRTREFYSSAALIGRGYPTATGPTSEGSVNQFAIDLGASAGVIRPDASFRVYLDRLLKAQASATFSFGLTVAY